MSNNHNVIIVGGTGFGAGELLRLLINHPNVEVSEIISSSCAGDLIENHHPHLKNLYPNKRFISNIGEINSTDTDNLVFFCALPHGKSGEQVKNIYSKYPKAKIIDLSGDLRIDNPQLHSKYYQNSVYQGEIQKISTYGLPELFENKIKGSNIISNPGCLATAAILSVAPISKLYSDLSIQIEPKIILNLATGSSGSGKEPKQSTHHPIRHANFLAYKALNHQHEPEIIQTLEKINLIFNSVSFVPHSLPISRGILCTTYLEANSDLNVDSIINLYKSFYIDSFFIRVLEKGMYAEIENVVGSNFCDISINTNKNQIVIHSAIDNLVKGMAGQAIENMNLMLGLDRNTGLKLGGLRPI
jgi:N-acetyl-gamma-glutamyl-phosphate reductase